MVHAARKGLALLPRLIVAAVAITSASPGQWGPVAASTPPSARSGALAGYDAANGRVLLFGGNFGNETWSYQAASSQGGAWTQLQPANVPPARTRAAIATDVPQGRLVLYGGTGTVGLTTLDDTWIWTGSDWQQLAPTSTPGGRDRHAMAYDLTRDTVVLFGGRNNLSQPQQALADTFEFANGTWTPVVSPHTPPGLAEPAMAYLPSLAQVVLFGGVDSNGFGSDQTWAFDGSDWTQLALTGPRPPARYGARLEANLARSVLVLVGGRDATTLAIVNDTWEFDGVAWRQINNVYGGLYPPRAEFACAHDLGRDRLVVFGGSNATGFAQADTYEFGAHFQPFGLTCTGSAGAVQLVSVAPPRLANVCRVDVVNLPPAVPLAAFAIGLSRQQWAGGSLPFLLTGLGLTGCRAYTSAELIVQLLASNGVASWTFPFPNQASLLGNAYHVQGLSLDPGWNPAGLVTSNAATLVVGY